MQPKTALLLINTQVNMFTPEPVHDGEALLARLAAVLDGARRAGWPIVHVQNQGGPGEPDEPETPGWLIHPLLAAAADETVRQKETPDAFAGTGLQAMLDAHGIRRLVIAGMQTEQCVDTTVRAASGHGYEVTLVADGHSTFDGDELTAVQIIAHHNQILGAFAQVVPGSGLDFAPASDADFPNLNEPFSAPDLAQIETSLQEMRRDGFRYHHPVHALNTLRLAWDADFVPPVYRLAPSEWHVGLAEAGLLRRLRRLPAPFRRIVGAEVTAVVQKLLKATLQAPDENTAPLNEAQTIWRYRTAQFRIVYYLDTAAKHLTLLALADRPAPAAGGSPLAALKKRWGLA